ncbi:hypothetical protein NQ318_017899 [Aromia moschata]|uniref:Fibronectin type-III domain-containing protein n=1 Tax=Aromia moschata TaxID=1265417 RepID=A0AAV8YE43_9CUCU|nr:hypothetical protein NQ318_017899 [Aromia moschata]
MDSYGIFFLVLFALGGVHLSKQEVCEPGYVTNLTLNQDYTLSWETPPDETCEIQSYIVFITTLNGTLQYALPTMRPAIQFHTLPECTSYIFRVHQVSTDNVQGLGWSVQLVTPPTSDANLQLQYVRISQTETHARLEWSLEEEWASCASRYRVVIIDEDTNDATDIYTQATFVNLNSVVPCGRYTVGVVALFTLVEQGPIFTIQHTSLGRVTNVPQVTDLQIGSTSATITVELEEYSRNRCALSNLIFDASPSFNLTYTIQNQANRVLPVTITNLVPNTLYYLRISAVNTAGSSNPFLLAIQTRES